MSKVDPLDNLASLQNETTAVQTINSNNDKIEAAFQNTLSRDGSTPNTMSAALDLNGNRVLNVGAPQAAGDAVNRQYVDDTLGGLTPELISNIAELPELVAEAELAAEDAAQSAIEAASYVGAAIQAPKWTTARTFTASGDIAGTSPPVDGTANITWSMSIANGAVTGPKMSSGAAVSNIGYTPLNKAGDSILGQVINSWDPTSSLDQNAVGYRGIPMVYLAEDIVFVLSHCGKYLRHDSPTNHVWGISNLSTTPYPPGYAVMIRNVSTGTVLLYRAPGVLLLKDGSGVSADITVGQWGKALLVHEGSNIWSVGGTGLT